MKHTDGNYSQDDWDNYSRQLDPQHDTYWTDRGHDGRPDDWQDRIG